MTRKILRVNHLAKSYKNKHVLKDVSFEINSGEIIALLGENGAGKSTLINIINKIIKPTKGEVTLFEGQLNHKKSKEKTGIMLQQNIILKRLTVNEVIELARSYYPQPRPYEELITIARLNNYADQDMTQLSGGQQRALNFSTALAGNPDLIFLDEPTTNMDARLRHEVWKQIGELKDQGKTIIVTSHYLEELEDVATRVLILQNGVIAYDGSVQELRMIHGQGMIEFESELPESIFESMESILIIDRQANHYRLITKDVNNVMKQLVGQLDLISNLSIQQTSLDTLFTYYRKEKS